MDLIKDITDFIFIESDVGPADVIFLPGGSDPSLPEKAAELYAEGMAPLIAVSGKYGKQLGRFKGLAYKRELYPGDYRTEAEFYLDVLTKNGVPEGAVLCEDEAEYTYQNAVFTRRMLERLGVAVSKAILVCKAFHSRRAYTYYKNEFPDITLGVTPVPGFGISPENWYKTERGRARVAGELSRIGDQLPSLLCLTDDEKV